MTDSLPIFSFLTICRRCQNVELVLNLTVSIFIAGDFLVSFWVS